MSEFVYAVFEVSGFILQIVLVVLLSFQVRRYPVLFLYAVVYLVTTGVESYFAHTAGRRSAAYSNVYWGGEVITDLLLFLVVISLTYQASRDNPNAGILQKFLGGVVLLAVLLPFLLLNRPYFTVRWFNGTSQLLNFGGAIMNLVLWTVLLGKRRKDPQLLLVSVGVGITVTGAAISWGVRLFLTPQDYWVPNVFLIGSYLAGVIIWCWAFRPLPRTPREQNGPVSSRA